MFVFLSADTRFSYKYVYILTTINWVFSCHWSVEKCSRIVQSCMNLQYWLCEEFRLMGNYSWWK